jgi:4-amino-4-deoxy-L-arabinose transferase-like glycosyltransferase
MTVNTTTHADTGEAASAALPRSRLDAIVLIALLLIGAFLLVYHLDKYPAPWYDEGSHLHVAKNFALNGVYADFSSEGNRPFGPAVGVGPTVLLPIALLFKVAGVSIPLARAVIVVYGVLALSALYVLTARLVNPRTALVALALALLSPAVDFVYNARTVLGEVPGLFFILAGLWLWSKPGKHSIRNLLLVGLMMGLACITKNQYALFILPSLLLAWFADLLWYKRRGWMYFVIPGIVAGVLFFAWTFVVILLLGQTGGSFSQNLADLRSASAGAFFVFKPSAIESALRFLVDGALYGGLAIPVLIYGLVISLRRDEQGQQFGTIMIFIVMGLGLFVSSLAWPRYAFAPVVLLAIVAVRLFYDLTAGFNLDWKGIRTVLRGEPMPASALGTILVVGLLVVMLVLPLYTQAHRVMTQGRTDAYETAAYMNSNIPQDQIIETWEPELGVLSDRTFHYPPQIVLAKSVAAQWFGDAPVSESYDFRAETDAAYVIVGPFAKYTNVYPADRLADYVLIDTIGAYDIYQRTPAS